jgi:hypothetical protein
VIPQAWSASVHRDGYVRAVVAVAAGVACLGICASAMALGDANVTASCGVTESSPGFRRFLPDCRAYELVSPPYTAGGLPYGPHEELPPVSTDGEHLISLDFAGFAGAENVEYTFGEVGAIYEFSRGLSGWGAESLEPPASGFPRQSFLFASANLSRTLWELQTPTEGGQELPITPPNGVEAINNATLAVRESAGGGKGRFTVVGPLAPPGHEPSAGSSGEPEVPGVLGASADLESILLQSWAEGKQTWPGDQTLEGKNPSLYEYRETSDGEPVLVGVKNEGSLVEEARLDGRVYVNEDAELVSRCGTMLGSDEIRNGSNERIGSTYNAVSVNGEVVYFTALHETGSHEACAVPSVNELYARIDADKTVDISEPADGPGGDCESCKESERKPAVFAGASQDGSKVFFTSEQELLPEAKGSSLYEYNFDASNRHARVTLIAPDIQLSSVANHSIASVSAIAETGGRVYIESQSVLSSMPNANGEAAEAGASNLYMRETESGRIAFVTSGARSGFKNHSASAFHATADGQYLVFESPRRIAGTNDTSNVGQLFEYDTATEAVTRVSAGQTSSSGYLCEATKTFEEGYNCDGNITTEADIPRLPAAIDQGIGEEPPTAAASSLSVAENGAVAFESRDALTPHAVAGGENIYEYEDGNTYLISTGDETVQVRLLSAAGVSRLLGISASGQDIFFKSNDSLVPQDTGTQTAWYDARAGGGFPAPTTQPACLAGTCQGPLSTPPVLQTPSSASTAGGGNFTPGPAPQATVIPKPKSVKCKKGYVKKKAKCVKKSKAAKAAGRTPSDSQK